MQLGCGRSVSTRKDGLSSRPSIPPANLDVKATKEKADGLTEMKDLAAYLLPASGCGKLWPVPGFSQSRREPTWAMQKRRNRRTRSSCKSHSRYPRGDYRRTINHKCVAFGTSADNQRYRLQHSLTTPQIKDLQIKALLAICRLYILRLKVAC